MHAAQHHLQDRCCVPKQRRSPSMPTMQRENRGPTHWQNSEARTNAPLENPHTARLASFVKKSRRCIESPNVAPYQSVPHQGTQDLDHYKLSEVADARKAVRQGPEPALLKLCFETIQLKSVTLPLPIS